MLSQAINFGIIYGQSAFGLAKGLAIPVNDAKKYIETYFQRYPGIQVTCRHAARAMGGMQDPRIHAGNGVRYSRLAVDPRIHAGNGDAPPWRRSKGGRYGARELETLSIFTHALLPTPARLGAA
jgi:hypothetical protein